MEKEQTGLPERIKNLEVVDAEYLAPEGLVHKGEEYFYLDHIPHDDRGDIIRQVVEDAMKDYHDPTWWMNDEAKIEFDKAMKAEVRKRYGNWEKDLPSDVHHIDELEQNEDNPHDY